MEKRALFDLQAGRAADGVILRAVREGLVVHGSNAWLLAAAIFVACVGLNMASTAVIIGAMLISPLMGPIQGMGLALTMKDPDLLRRAARAFLVMVAISLSVATAYFAITPVKVANAEILARTSPTIWDVVIALAGGVAGMVAVTRSERNYVVLPGVAIATALMPPLCTVGFGLATWQPKIFLGAAYLFLINTVFIAWASFLVANVLGLSAAEVTGRRVDHRWRQWITVVLLAASVPSVYLAFGFVRDLRTREQAEIFITSHLQFEGTYVLRSDVRPGARRVEVYLIGDPLPAPVQDSLQDLFARTGPAGYQLRFNQDRVPAGPNPLDLQVQRLTERSALLARQLDSLRSEVAYEPVAQPDPAKQATAELQLLEPTARRVLLSTDSAGRYQLDLIVPRSLPQERVRSYANWLKHRLPADTVLITISVVR
ncbi:MAG: DUF389 domain-containing protein [Flavobacteriales bacterium]|nr:DUF389 domain-containing protein [Flavobacteriales bacterium]